MRRGKGVVEIIRIGGMMGSRRGIQRGVRGDEVDRARGRAWVRFLDEDIGRWSMSQRSRGGHGVHGTVRCHEVPHDGLEKLRADIPGCKDRVATFSTGDALNKIGVLHVVDKDINFLRVIERRGSVLDKRSKLKIITEELGVVKKVEITLAGVIGDKNGGLIMKDRVGEEQKVLERAKTITVASRDQARETAAFGKHIGLGEQTEERKRHAKQFYLHKVREIVSREGTRGEATFAAMIGAETPQRMDIEAVIHAALDKLGVPGANTGVGIVVTQQRGLEEILVVGRNVMNEQRAVREKNLVKTFEVVEVTTGVGGRGGGTKDRTVSKFVVVTGKDIGW
jgi:hypothetical protein